MEYKEFGIENCIGNILNEKINICDLKKIDIKDLYMVNIVAVVNCQNEIVAHNRGKLKNGK